MAVPPSAPPAVAASLTLALIASSDAPLLLLDGDLRVVAASKSFGRAFGAAPHQAEGKLIFELGSGEWDLPRLRSLLGATASGHAAIDAYELDLKMQDGDARRAGDQGREAPVRGRQSRPAAGDRRRCHGGAPGREGEGRFGA